MGERNQLRLRFLFVWPDAPSGAEKSAGKVICSKNLNCHSKIVFGLQSSRPEMLFLTRKIQIRKSRIDLSWLCWEYVAKFQSSSRFKVQITSCLLKWRLPAYNANCLASQKGKQKIRYITQASRAWTLCVATVEKLRRYCKRLQCFFQSQVVFRCCSCWFLPSAQLRMRVIATLCASSWKTWKCNSQTFRRE